ncbi:MAG: hypothetical protein LUH82_06290 [Clostridiales bacterium]|nr:hypothetical protein [Clostridiales bacterium]
MKKVLASLLALMLLICASITAFGATSTDVKEIISAAVKYAFPYDGAQKTDGYSVDTSKYFLMHVKSGEDVSAYESAYFDSLKAALDSGSLTGLGSLSMAMQIMYYLDIDAADFQGYNLIEMFSSTDVTAIDYNPYYYAYACETASLYELDDFGKSLCDALISTYYTPGTGTDYWGGWGTSADDLSSFLIALAPYSADYGEYIEDALALLETYLADTGYGYGYGDSNADSTAMALAAYSALGQEEKASSVYELLITNFYDSETGGFTSDYDPYYATSDAVYALEYYAALLSGGEASESTTAADETTTAQTTALTTAAASGAATLKSESTTASTTGATAESETYTQTTAVSQSSETTAAAELSAAAVKSPSTGAACFAVLGIMLPSAAGVAVLKRRK